MIMPDNDDMSNGHEGSLADPEEHLQCIFCGGAHAEEHCVYNCSQDHTLNFTGHLRLVYKTHLKSMKGKGK